MKKYALLSMLILCCLSGCGSNSSDLQEAFNLSEESSEKIVVDKKNKEEDLTLLDNKSTANDVHKIQYKVDSTTTNGNMTVDASYEEFDLERLKTFSINKIQMDDAQLRELASHIFDKGEFEVRRPVSILSPTEKSEELTKLNVELANLKEEDLVGGFYVSDIYTNLEKDSAIPAQLVGDSCILEYEETSEDEKMVYYYKLGELQGKIDGKDYVLVFRKFDYEDVHDPKHKLFHEGFVNIEIYSPLGAPYKQHYMDSEFDVAGSFLGDNLSDYESCYKKAQDLVDSLGFDYYKMTRKTTSVMDKNVNGIITHEDMERMYTEEREEDLVANGYSFHFSPVLDDSNEESFAGIVTMSENGEENAMLNYAEQPYIDIEVDRTGITNIFISDYYSIEEKTTDQINLLDFKKADENVRKIYEDHYTDYYNIYDIKAKYMIVKYGKTYSIVPAWIYYDRNLAGIESAVLGVNALDGSVYNINNWFADQY